ncbi:hypothetical protein WJX73_010518 [Symbiochloris irregularis]|uniref:Uncharacterized protein n=1 Tax=Symbiochloris irregularis TaxID=706552 RepID=A0AAW1NME0_9CHLO
MQCRAEGAADKWAALQGKQVWLAELASELNRLVLPRLNEENIKLYLTSIGPPPRGLEFADLTGYPADRLLADPENVTYSALGFKKSVGSTFFSWQTPQAIWRRIQKDGAQALKDILKKTKLWIPGQQSQGLQQGGSLIFDGKHATKPREAAYEVAL